MRKPRHRNDMGNSHSSSMLSMPVSGFLVRRSMKDAGGN